MKRPECILFISQDLSVPFTKTTEYLSSAAERMGLRTIVRDSSDARMMLLLFSKLDQATHLIPEIEKDLLRKNMQLIDSYGIDCVMSLDLGWLILPDLFIEHPAIKKIYSIWYDDFMSFLGASTNTIFPYHNHTFQEIVKHPKVIHSFYGQAMARESMLLGFSNQISSKLAAPREFLELNYPCKVKDKLAFIGNPGFRGEPHPDVIKLLDQGADLLAMRELSRAQLLYTAESGEWKDWVVEPTIVDLLKLATALKCENPFTSSMQILEVAGTHYPTAFEILNKQGNLLKAAWAVKLVLRYDRPALVYRLYKKGLVDVISNPEEWKPYGVESTPSIIGDHLTEAYMRYFAHINASNCLRDATANEKLFEVSACGRTSINIDSPDVRECYGPEEIFLVNSLKEAEEAAQQLIANPDMALTMGKKARRRTALQHTWDHRMASLIGHFDKS